MNADLSRAQWFKSTYSSSSGGECLEAAHLSSGEVAVRDSKLGGSSPVLVFGSAAWDRFARAVQAGTFDPA
ncbi:DUF397 domain-containing protein [Nocardia yunnanensis]|uniref:DUF397 domain-containing protein n=1 Tax=Nocardia yunnanensis TaxID=2382165 RepID=A0A386ZEG8_9NOCA|nr:DUF397 domain-containing protein [Nocardia yunnanensis]AYF75787.1 DUF397 domain-containing protein [Nocardia yunnanensis]